MFAIYVAVCVCLFAWFLSICFSSPSVCLCTVGSPPWDKVAEVDGKTVVGLMKKVENVND